MGAHEPTLPGGRGGTRTLDESSSEHLKVDSAVLAAKVKDLLHEGSVRRIIVKNEQGHTVMEIPVIAGVLVAIVAPVLAAVAAVAALAGNWEIEIHRSPELPGGR